MYTLDALLCECCKIVVSVGLFAPCSRKQTISMSYTDTKASDEKRILKFCRRLDAVLDRFLCECCRYDKNELPLEALETWEPDRNCNKCRYLFEWADDPDEHPTDTSYYSERSMHDEHLSAYKDHDTQPSR